MTTPNDTDAQEFVSAFNGDTDEQPKEATAGYGIDPRQADADEMAAAFNAADVSIGAPMPTREIEANELPPASGDTPATSAEPVTEIQVTEKTADPKAPPEFKTFGQAFKWHREQAVKHGGPKVFEWNGQKKTTLLKSEWEAMQAARKAKANPAAIASVTSKPPASTSGVATPAGKTGALVTSLAAGKAPSAIDRSKTLAFKEAVGTPSSPAPYSPALPQSVAPLASYPAAPAGQSKSAPAPAQTEPLSVRKQKAYDEWQRQLSDSKTWWGGDAIPKPGQKERLQEAESNFTKLLSATK